MIIILVTNQFVVCCGIFILISDTMQYDNVHMTQNIKRSLLLGHIEKSRNTKGPS